MKEERARALAKGHQALPRGSTEVMYCSNLYCYCNCLAVRGEANEA